MERSEVLQLRAYITGGCASPVTRASTAFGSTIIPTAAVRRTAQRQFATQSRSRSHAETSAMAALNGSVLRPNGTSLPFFAVVDVRDIWFSLDATHGSNADADEAGPRRPAHVPIVRLLESFAACACRSSLPSLLDAATARPEGISSERPESGGKAVTNFGTRSLCGGDLRRNCDGDDAEIGRSR
jgi:hypothetical protein